MADGNVIVRAVTEDDASAICAIYNPFVANTAITFEALEVSEFEMQSRIRAITQSKPWLVLETQGYIAGFAYSCSWKQRSAYRKTEETTIYIGNEFQNRGFGKVLYGALLDQLIRQDCHTVLGCIALPNQASVGLHQYFGFRKVGHFNEVGYKFGRWIDIGYWQKKF